MDLGTNPDEAEGGPLEVTGNVGEGVTRKPGVVVDEDEEAAAFRAPGFMLIDVLEAGLVD